MTRSSEMNEQPSRGTARIAYIVSKYPALNHAFMVREIRALREGGLQIEVASISEPDRHVSALTEEEKSEAAAAFYVKAQPIGQIFRAHASTFFSRPGSYCRGVLEALRLAKFHPRETLFHLFYFAEAVVVGDWMRRKELRHAHVHYATTVALIASKTFPVSISATLHGPDEFSNPAATHLKEKIEACTFVIAISDFARSQMMLHSDHSQWHKFHVVRLGVDASTLQRLEPRPDPQPFRLLCAARLAPVKGQHLLLDAIKLLVRRGRNVVLHLAGDGPDRASLKEQTRQLGIEDRVIFEGFVNQDRMQRLYSQVDAVVLASFAEGLPVVLMESMSLGIPCISTWVNGVPELIRDGIDGLTVPPSDAGALADAIEKLSLDPALRSRISVAARARAKEVVDLTRNVSRQREIFNECLGIVPELRKQAMVER